MEGIHSDNDADDKDKVAAGKKKRSEAIGLFATEPKAEKNAAEKRDDLLSLLTGKTVKIEQADQEPESVNEAEQLTPSEERLVEREIVLGLHEEHQSTDTPDVGEENLAADTAVESFHEKILNDDLDSSQALAETLAEINSLETEAISITEVSEIADPAASSPVELTEEPIAINRPSSEALEKVDTHKTDSPRDSRPMFGPSSITKAEKPAAKDEVRPSNTPRTSDIVGYILGRREGITKTEKRLAPIQKKLEQQVVNLQREIVAKEFTIRQAVTERVRSEVKPNQIIRPEAIRAKAPEANHLHSDVAPERIGRVLVTAEAYTSPNVETATLQPIDKHIETLSRADLLELSGKTVVDGSSLRQAYETNLISEKGLRRVIIEHLRGGDVRRALRRELVEHEIDFERDPQLRDRSRKSAGGAGTTLNNLLQRVDASTRHEEAQELSVYKARAAHASKQQSRSQQRRSWLDIALISIIAVLLILVLALVLNRQ